MSKLSYAHVLVFLSLLYSGSVIAMTGKITIEYITGLGDYDSEDTSYGNVYVRVLNDSLPPREIQGKTLAVDTDDHTVTWNHDIEFEADTKILVQVLDVDGVNIEYVGGAWVTLTAPDTTTYCPHSGLYFETISYEQAIYHGIVLTGAILHFTIYTGECDSGPVLTVQVDNFASFKRSDDAGTTWTDIGSPSDNWLEASVLAIDDPTTDTRVRLICTDGGGVGGLIGSLSLTAFDSDGLTYTYPVPTSSYGFISYWSVVNVDSSSLVYNLGGSGAWGNVVDSNIASDAYWVWDDQVNNVITFEFKFSQLTIIPHQYANVWVQCDNTGTYYTSLDGGSTWEYQGTQTAYNVVTKFEFEPTSSAAIIHFQCEDLGGVGGLIATVKYNEVEYSTTSPLLDSKFSIVYTGNDDLVYTASGSGAWGNRVDSSIDSSAEWVWNGNTFNTITFEFSFITITNMASAKQAPSFIDYNNNNNDFLFQELNDKIIENTNDIYYIGLLVVASFALIVICLSVSNCKQWLCKKKGKYSKIQQFDQSSVSDNV